MMVSFGNTTSVDDARHPCSRLARRWANDASVGATRHNCQRSCASHLFALPRRFEAQLRWQSVVQVWLHSTGAASPLAALLLPQILPDILGRRALPSGRLACLGATPDLHHGLLAASIESSHPSVTRHRPAARSPYPTREKASRGPALPSLSGPAPKSPSVWFGDIPLGNLPSGRPDPMARNPRAKLRPRGSCNPGEGRYCLCAVTRWFVESGGQL